MQQPLESLFWCDLETTGLDPQSDYILEVAWTGTDYQLNPLAGSKIKVAKALVFPSHHVMTKLANADENVRNMHDESGLTSDLQDTLAGKKYGHTLAALEGVIIEYMNTLESEIGAAPDHKWVIAGSTPTFDLSFIQEQMPLVAKRLSFRAYNVSMLRSWFTKTLGLSVYDSSLGKTHRADVDILDHLNEARAYTAYTLDRVSIPSLG